MTAERENRAPAQRHGPDLATLEARLASKFWREQRKRSLAALALEPGDRALSVGCGLGTTVALMAERVGSAGEAVGVDGSATVIERARSRTDREARIRLEVAGPEALPFETKRSTRWSSKGPFSTWVTQVRASPRSGAPRARAHAWWPSSPTGIPS
ncbi:MAG: hypothetical protein NVSMB25_21300 [Thermoleophilaceae bacterium]